MNSRRPLRMILWVGAAAGLLALGAGAGFAYAATRDGEPPTLPVSVAAAQGQAEPGILIAHVESGSPAMRDLARRLLLSSAEAPAGPQTANLLTVRAERLAALGDQTGAASLLALVPESRRDASTERIRLDAAFLAGRDEQACADAAALIQRFNQDVYLQKALIYCQARAGQTDQATQVSSSDVSTCCPRPVRSR